MGVGGGGGVGGEDEKSHRKFGEKRSVDESKSFAHLSPV